MLLLSDCHVASDAGYEVSAELPILRATCRAAHLKEVPGGCRPGRTCGQLSDAEILGIDQPVSTAPYANET